MYPTICIEAAPLRIWIDLSNSPHPLLFKPVAGELEQRGHSVHVTARDNAQTLELARERFEHVDVIGGPSPKGRKAKAAAVCRRVMDLRRWAIQTRPDIALSHNSYAQLVAAKLQRIPAVTAMDFEHQPANHLAFRLARTVLLPSALEPLRLERQGATAAKTRFYPGLKEELYLSDFHHDPTVLERLNLASQPPGAIVLARPEPNGALYHSFENPLFVRCVKAALRDPRVTVVVLPRTPEQRDALSELRLPRCVIADRAVDSRSLMSLSDLMIGAGGTMTREAALMGVPTVSLFAGKRPAVDRWLEQQGMLRIIRDESELPSIEPQPRADRLADLRRRGNQLVTYFCDALEPGVATPPV
jgi:uncharacterized protein